MDRLARWRTLLARALAVAPVFVFWVVLIYVTPSRTMADHPLYQPFSKRCTGCGRTFPWTFQDLS